VPSRGVCLALYASSLAALFSSPLGQRWPFVDLGVYRLGGQAVLEGAHLYALRFPGDLAFTYPPLAAIAFAGLGAVGMGALELVVTAGNIVLLPLALGFALRLPPLSARISRDLAARIALLAAAAAVWLEPVWTTFRYGQIDVLIAALILYDLSRADAFRWKGAAIGLASGLKLTPAIFAAYLLLTRRYRAAAVSLAVFAATVLVGLAAAPGDSREFWGGAFMDPARVGRIENTANQALRGAYARLLHSSHIEAWWLVTAVLVGAIGMVLAIRAGRRGDEVQGFSLCALTGLLVSPVSWSHHWVLATPALLLFAVSAQQRAWAAGLACAALAAAIGYSHMIWWVPVNHPSHSELHLDPLQLVYADGYVLLALAALAAVAWRVGSPARWLARTPLTGWARPRQTLKETA
jgi:alpha-1,2-mannosyltransferase